MVKRGPKLKEALDRHQGRDRGEEVQKKRAKQLQKTQIAQPSDKRKDKSSKRADKTQIQATKEDIAAEGGVALNTNEDEEWEDEDEDTDEEAEAGFDMSRLEDSDSDSSDEDDDDADGGDDSMRQVKAALASLRANGIPATKTNVAQQKSLKSALKPQSAPKLTATAQVGKEDDDEDDLETDAPADADVDDVASDIPLDELSETGSATEDLVPHRRLTINNTAALTRALASFALPLSSLPFSEHQSVTTKDLVTIADIDDDLNRELALYAQSLSAVQAARRLLKKEGVPYSRPTDYFAEMVKSDEHMGKVKGKLVADAVGKQASADAKRQRELKKFGKQVQQEKLKERAQAKKAMMDKVGAMKRKRQGGELDSAGGGDTDMFGVDIDEPMESSGRDAKRRKSDGRRFGDDRGAKAGGANPKRAQKNEKFGFGGKKRFAKSGDAESAGDMRAFSSRKMKGSAKGKGGTSSRPGKARRAKARA